MSWLLPELTRSWISIAEQWGARGPGSSVGVEGRG